METNEPTVEANCAKNPTRTPPIPVNGVLEPVLRCLLDWLEQKNNGQKNHQILIALASESLKKIDAPEASRKFDKRDIWSACQTDGEKDLGSWLKWPDIEKYWKVRRDDFLDFADFCGMDHYPVLERKATTGRNETLYWISARPIAELKRSEAEEGSEIDATPEKGAQSNKSPGLELGYQCTQPGDIACAFLLKPWLNNGKVVLQGWRAWSVALPLFTLGMTMLGIIWLALAQVGRGNVGSNAIISSLFLLGFAYLVWIFLIRPMKYLGEDRIICAEGAESFKEQSGQLELVRSNSIRTIHLIRYSSSCAVCGASVTVEKGEPDFPRRLVGRCAESPREHVFSFDRVTRKGKALR
jgi:hypothetical protein